MTAEPVPVSEGSPEWLAQRKTGVTASEVAAIVGISPWQSAFNLYCYKRGEIPEQVDREEMEWGRAMEGLVLNRFQHRHPEFRVHPGALFRSRTRPWQMATPDGLAYATDAAAVDPIATVQVKTAGYRGDDEWGDEGTDQIPVHYRAQVQWEMDTLGCQLAFVPVLFAGRRYAEYLVEYDHSDVTEMRKHAEAFLQRVQDNNPPDVDADSSTRAALQRLYRELVDLSIEVPSEAVRAYRSWRETERVAKQMRGLAENQIRDAMGHASRGLVGGEVAVTRSRFDRSGLDVRGLRAAAPELAHEYTTQTTVDRINVRPAATADDAPNHAGDPT